MSRYPGESLSEDTPLLDAHVSSGGRRSSGGQGGVPSLVEDDEAFARRLQMEELAHARFGPNANVNAPAGHEAGAGGAGAGAAPNAGGGGANQPPARQQVREAMLAGLLSQTRFATISFWLIAAINLPQIVWITIVSITQAHRFNSCDKPLNLWLILHGARLLGSVILAGLPVCSRRRWNPTGERYRSLNDSMQLAGFCIFVIGNFWIFDSHTCKDLNPVVYQTAFYLLIFQYAMMMLPCLLLCCLAPCVFCCLPLLIRVSGFLPAGVGLRLAGQQGADRTAIEQLPPPKPFKRGMFGASPSAAAAPASSAPSSGRARTSSTEDEAECSICLANYEPGELVRQLPCVGAHHFHRACIDDWLKVNATCPCCRESMLPIIADPALGRARAAAADASRNAASAAPAQRSSDQQHAIDIRA